MAPLMNQADYPAEFALHQKYASCDILLDLVWTHSLIITEMALSLYEAQLFDTSAIDRTLLIKSCLLHDLGSYVCGGFEWIPGLYPIDRPYAEHTVAGAELLRQEGLNDQIIRVAQVHAGVGLTPEDIKKYGMLLPELDYMPACPLEWLITYTAKFHSKTPQFRNASEIETSLLKYGVDKADRFRQLEMSFGIPNVEAFAQKYDEWHRHFDYRVKQMKAGNSLYVITEPETNLNPAGISSTSQPIASTTPITAVDHQLSTHSQPPMTLNPSLSTP